MTEAAKEAARRHTISIGLALTMLVQTCAATWWVRGQESRITTNEMAVARAEALAKSDAALARAERTSLSHETAELSAQVRVLTAELRLLREQLASGRHQ